MRNRLEFAPSFGACRIYVKFLMLFVPVFVAFCAAGLLVLVEANKQAAYDQLSARVGSNAARIAHSLGNSLEGGHLEASQSLIGTLLGDRAIECAEYRADAKLSPDLMAPFGIGCTGRDNLELLRISVGSNGQSELLIRFSDQEIVEIVRSQREFSFAILMGGLLIALIASAAGFAIFMGRPLRRLLHAIRAASEGGVHQDVVVNGRDEMARVATAYNELQSRIAAYSSELENKIVHDELTGLFNRAGFNNQLDKLINGRPQARFALIIADINDFKILNDHHGHWTGDASLLAAARLLQKLVGTEHFVCRIGGDEFAILVAEKVANDGTRERIIEQLRKCDLEVNCADEKVRVEFSFGAALYPEDGENASTLMKHSDLAMYSAKKNHHKHVQLFNSAMALEFDKSARIRKQFRDALTSQELEPYYQPLINLSTGKVEGLEALVRWSHPQFGLLSPGEFEDIFDDREAKALLARSMTESILSDISAWKLAGVQYESVGLNVEITDLEDRRFLPFVFRKLREFDVEPRDLAIEITENTALEKDNKFVMLQLHEIRSAGMFIALDDFGTGYSSLTHLRDLPLTTLKLDKSFVRNIVHSDKEHAIAGCLVEMSKRLGVKCIAEGIEEPEELSALRELNCDMGQGFLFARPMPACEVPEMIERLNAIGSLSMLGRRSLDHSNSGETEICRAHVHRRSA